MAVEVRLSDADQLDAALGLDADIISLGSDGCPYKVPDVDLLRRTRERVMAAGKAFKVVTSVVPCNHYERMVGLIHSLAEQDEPVQVVVNDYGLLYGAKEVWASSRLQPVAGVLMSLSRGRIIRGKEITDGFVHALTAAGRPKEMIDLYKWLVGVTDQNSMHCRMRVRLLKESFRVVGMECELAERVLPSLKAIRDLGLRVSAHVGRIVATVSRACPTARFFRESPPACAGRCNEVSTLTARGLSPLGVGAVLDSETEQRVLAAIPKFHIRGNVVLHEGLSAPDRVGPGSVDDVVIDIRDYPSEETSRLCAQWKESGKLSGEGR